MDRNPLRKPLKKDHSLITAKRAPTSESPPASGLFRPHSGLSPKPKLGQARTQFWLRASWAALPGARCQGGIASKSVGKPEATTAWPHHGQLFPSESQLPNPHLLPAFFGLPVASLPGQARRPFWLRAAWAALPGVRCQGGLASQSVGTPHLPSEFQLPNPHLLLAFFGLTAASQCGARVFESLFKQPS